MEHLVSFFSKFVTTQSFLLVILWRDIVLWGVQGIITVLVTQYPSFSSCRLTKKKNNGDHCRLNDRTPSAKSGSLLGFTLSCDIREFCVLNSVVSAEDTLPSLSTLELTQDISFEGKKSTGGGAKWKPISNAAMDIQTYISTPLGVDNRVSCFPVNEDLPTQVFETLLFYMYLEICCLWLQFYND